MGLLAALGVGRYAVRMEKRKVLVALALGLALGCGGEQAALDGGSDAQVSDMHALEDVAVGDDEGVDAGADAGDPQCAGMPDFTACDDGRSWTLDGCIGGACVGRVCSENQVPRNCNTARLTLTSCEGVPFENGTTCDDGDPFTTNDECSGGVCGGDPCPCPPGEPCCGAACAFLPDTYECDEWVELVCLSGPICGRDYEARFHRVFCSGVSATCDGVDEVSETSVADCPVEARCVDGSYRHPNDDEVGVTIGCVPSPSC